MRRRPPLTRAAAQRSETSTMRLPGLADAVGRPHRRRRARPPNARRCGRLAMPLATRALSTRRCENTMVVGNLCRQDRRCAAKRRNRNVSLAKRRPRVEVGVRLTLPLSVSNVRSRSCEFLGAAWSDPSACPVGPRRSSIHQQGGKQDAADSERGPRQFIGVESKPSPPPIVPASDG